MADILPEYIYPHDVRRGKPCVVGRGGSCEISRFTVVR